MAEVSLVNDPEPTVVTFPDSPFKLHQPFPPAGDQPTAIAGLVEGIDDGLSFQTLLGVTGSGKTYTMANVIARLGRTTTVPRCPERRDLNHPARRPDSRTGSRRAAWT